MAKKRKKNQSRTAWRKNGRGAGTRKKTPQQIKAHKAAKLCSAGSHSCNHPALLGTFRCKAHTLGHAVSNLKGVRNQQTAARLYPAQFTLYEDSRIHSSNFSRRAWLDSGGTQNQVNKILAQSGKKPKKSKAQKPGRPSSNKLPTLVPGRPVQVGKHANRKKKNWNLTKNTGNGKPWEDEVERILDAEEGKVERYTDNDAEAIGADFTVTLGRKVKYVDAKVVVKFPANQVARIKQCAKEGSLYEVIEKAGRYYVTPDMLMDDGARVLKYNMTLDKS